MRSLLSGEVRRRAGAWLAGQWREWRAFILFFLLVWVPLRSAVIDYNPVPTGSMNPTILEGDVVWVNKLAYGLRVPLTQIRAVDWDEPARGDIVVVLSPQDGTRLVKRVAGIPGDTLAMIDNRLILNGEALEYHRPSTGHAVSSRSVFRSRAVFADEDLAGVVHPVMGLAGVSSLYRNFEPVLVPAGHYYLLGDSRDNSLDSREYGMVSRDAILGKAEGILASLDLHDRYRPRFERFFTRLH